MNDYMVRLEDVDYVYKIANRSAFGTKALSGVDLSIEEGQFVAVIGRNGSGKSTLARLMNAILLPSEGVVYVNGISTMDGEKLWDIRKTAGMVFQNPENQIVGTIVEEDVAFGPENLGVAPEEIRKRVEQALEIVGLLEYSRHAPHLLSGGQKQKVAIAGVLAMKPKCVILDEATAMLDPSGRKEVLKVLKDLNENEKITVIHITHHMDEACLAKRVIVIDDGKVVLDGKPGEVFSNVDKIKGLGMDVPQITELFYELNKCGYDLPLDVLESKAAVEHILNLIEKKV